jgi:hypothetical protein
MARLSGTWTFTAIAKLADWDQRIVITGSTNADGAHPMVAGTVLPNVRGIDFEVKSQAFNPVLAQWLDSFQIELMSWHPVKGVVLTISADDRTSAPDADFDDLVVECTTTDPELTPPRLNGPPMDLTIPERYVRQKPDRPKPPRRPPKPRPPEKYKKVKP